MFRILVLQALYTLSDDQTEYRLRDRLSFMRFAGLALHDAEPDARTIRPCRKRLTRAGALARLFASFDAVLAERGFPARGRQIVDATVVGLAAKRTNRRRRLGREQQAVPRGAPHPRAGRRPQGPPRQRPRARLQPSLRGDRRGGRHDGAQLGAVPGPANTGSGVWADTACRSRCPPTSPAAPPAGRRCAAGSSTSYRPAGAACGSPPGSAARDWSCTASAGSAPPRGSPSPTRPAPGAARRGSRGEPRQPDQSSPRKAAHPAPKSQAGDPTPQRPTPPRLDRLSSIHPAGFRGVRLTHRAGPPTFTLRRGPSESLGARPGDAR